MGGERRQNLSNLSPDLPVVAGFGRRFLLISADSYSGGPRRPDLGEAG